MPNTPSQVNNLRDTLFLAICQCESLQNWLLQDPYSELDSKHLQPKLATIEHLLKQAFESCHFEQAADSGQTWSHPSHQQGDDS